MSRQQRDDDEISAQHAFAFYSNEYEPRCSCFAVRNRYAPQSFLYMLECRSAVWVCAQSRDVFITACITKKKWLRAELIVRTCLTWPEWLCAEVLISLFHAFMDSEERVAPRTCLIQRFSYM